MTVFGITSDQAQRILEDRKRLRRLEQSRDTVPERNQYRNAVRPCRLVFKSGNPGGASPTDTCSFIYDVKSPDGTATLLTDVAPLNPPRVPGVRYRTPTGSSLLGEMTIWEGSLKLWNAFEIPDFAPCDAPAPTLLDRLVARFLTKGGGS